MSNDVEKPKTDRFVDFQEALKEKGVAIDALQQHGFLANGSKSASHLLPKTNPENNPPEEHTRLVFGRSMC